MQIIDNLDIYMNEKFPDYYMVKKTDKERSYKRNQCNQYDY